MSAENCTTEVNQEDGAYRPVAEMRRPDPADDGDPLVCELGSDVVAHLVEAPEGTE